MTEDNITEEEVAELERVTKMLGYTIGSAYSERVLRLIADWRKLRERVAELEETILEDCKYRCVGREGYPGKLAHDANCLAWALDLERR